MGNRYGCGPSPQSRQAATGASLQPAGPAAPPSANMRYRECNEVSLEEQTQALKTKEIECKSLNASNATEPVIKAMLGDNVEFPMQIPVIDLTCGRRSNAHAGEQESSQYHKRTCKPTWDTITCWPETEPGQYQILPCAEYFLGFDPMKNATKLCHENGTWKEWTNYSQCYNSSDTKVTEPFNQTLDPSYEIHVRVLSDISTAGYSVSMLSLIFAFTIFASIRTLRCPRNILHMHLFFSFIMRAFVYLLKEGIFLLSIGLPNNLEWKCDKYVFSEPQEGIIWDCKLVFSIWQYFILANYSWILMEAFYLHNLVFKALFTDKSSVTLYIILGWGLPLLFLIPWIICRILLDDELCWTSNSNNYVYAILCIPVAVSNIICFIIFIRLVRIIFTKLQSSVCEQTQIYRRLAKSTLTLIPLFGVHYVVFIGFDWYWNSGIGLQAELTLLIIRQTFAAFQGFIVALLYCFLNSEVRMELNKTHFQWPHRRRRRNTDASDGKSILPFSVASSADKKK